MKARRKQGLHSSLAPWLEFEPINITCRRYRGVDALSPSSLSSGRPGGDLVNLPQFRASRGIEPMLD
jgi:hypothetical protein